MASGAKRILLSPASPRLQSANKRMAVFTSPQRVAGEPKLPSCSTPTGLGNVSSAAVKKRFAQSDEKPSRSRKRLFDFPRADIPLTARVVQKLDNAIHQINHYPADSVVCFVNIHPLDSDLSGGQRYPAFEQLRPDRYFATCVPYRPFRNSTGNGGEFQIVTNR